jgi:hypothetical protein
MLLALLWKPMPRSEGQDHSWRVWEREAGSACVFGTFFFHHDAQHHVFAPGAAINLHLIVAIICAAEVILPSVDV